MGKNKGKGAQNQKRLLKEAKQVAELKNLRKVGRTISKSKQSKQKDTFLKDFRFSTLVAQPVEDSPVGSSNDGIARCSYEPSTPITKETDIRETSCDGSPISEIQEEDIDVVIVENSAEESDLSESEVAPIDEKQVTKSSTDALESVPSTSDARKALCFVAVPNSDGVTALVLLNDSLNVTINGNCKLQVVKGQIEIFGHEVSQPDLPASVYCSKASGLQLMYGKTCAKTEQKLQKDSLSMLEKYFCNDLDKIQENWSSFETVVLSKSSSTFQMDFSCSFHPFKQIFVKSPEVGFANAKLAISAEEWRPVVSSIHQLLHQRQEQSFCVLLCGNKNTGKSTFSRFLTNSLLKSSRVVFYLDCDLGQSEFTPPGLISLTKVDAPLIGPPFTHQRKPEASLFFGNTSPKDDPSTYIRCIQEAFFMYTDQYSSQGPLLVNTQGWMKGLGLSLLADVMRTVNPSLVLQFRTQTEADRGFFALSDEWVQTQPGWSVDCQSKQSECMPRCRAPNTQFRIVDTPRKDHSENQKLKAVDYRKLSLLAYFAGMYHRNEEDLANPVNRHENIERPFLSLTPRIVYWKDVAVHVMHSKVPPSMMLASLNFSLVSLAYVNPSLIIEVPEDILAGGPKFLRNRPIAAHIGYGFIRNIDIGLKAFYVLTPTPYDDLMEVNALIKGNISLPVELLSKDNIGDSYYFTKEDSTEILGRRARKPRFNLKRRKFDSPMTS